MLVLYMVYDKYGEIVYVDQPSIDIIGEKGLSSEKLDFSKHPELSVVAKDEDVYDCEFKIINDLDFKE